MSDKWLAICGNTLAVLSLLLLLASFACYVLVVAQMFRRGRKAWGIVCIILVFALGVGYLVAFVYGWINCRRRRLRRLMTVWTMCLLPCPILTVIVGLMSCGRA